MAKSFITGRAISLANFENKTTIVGKAIYNGDIVFLPIGTNGISVLDFDDSGSFREIGRWGRKTPTFPSVEESPFRDTMFISDLLIFGDYLFAFDLNLPVVFILRIFNEELNFVNYIRRPLDYRGRPATRERKSEFLKPLGIDGNDLYIGHLVDIQKTFLNQNDQGSWIDEINFHKISFTDPPTDFEEFNKISGEDWSLINSLSISSLPDEDLEEIGIENILNKEEKFFDSILPTRLNFSQDATHIYMAYSFNLAEIDTPSEAKVFENSENRVVIFKYPKGTDFHGTKVNDLDSMVVHASSLLDSTGEVYQVQKDSENGNRPSIYQSISNVPDGETTYVGNESNFSFQVNFEINSSLNLGLGSESSSNRVFGVEEFGNYFYIACGGENIKVFSKSDIFNLDQEIVLQNTSLEDEQIIGLARSDEDLFVLSKDDSFVYARAMEPQIDGTLEEKGKATLSLDYDRIHANSDGSFFVSGSNLINGYFYGEGGLSDLGQVASDPILTPYKRPGWFTIPLLKNFRFLPECDVVSRGIGDGNYDVSYDGSLPPDSPVTHNFVPDDVEITPIKAMIYSADNFLEIFKSMFKNARGRLFGILPTENGSNLELSVGSIVYDGQIIENDSTFTLDVSLAVSDSYVRYDEPTNDIVLEVSGPPGSGEAVLATYTGSVWIPSPQVALTPKVVTESNFGVEMLENGDLIF